MLRSSLATTTGCSCILDKLLEAIRGNCMIRVRNYTGFCIRAQQTNASAIDRAMGGGSNDVAALDAPSRTDVGSHVSSRSDCIDRNVVTTTHMISETRVRESSSRGRHGADESVRSEKRVVVQMAVRHNAPRLEHDSGATANGCESEQRSNESDCINDSSASTTMVVVTDESEPTAANGDVDETSRACTIEEIDEDDAPVPVASSVLVVDARSSGSAAAPVALSATELTDVAIQQVMLQLVAETERMKQRLVEQEQALAHESDLIAHIKHEHKALKALAKDYKYRARLRKRVARTEREAKSKSASRSREKRKLHKKCRLLQDARRSVTQDLELLKAKNLNYEMDLERQMAELRREHETNFFLM